jgi:hypothetical protein
LAGRLDDALLFAFTDARPLTLALADGGRLLESSRWRCDVAELLVVSRPARMFPDALLLLPRLADCVFMVRTGMWEAPVAGAVRAITARFVTEDGGVDTRPRALAAPV